MKVASPLCTVPKRFCLVVTPSGRPRWCGVASSKGFGSGDGNANSVANIKVNERGKASSRPGPMSPKQQKQQQQQLKQQQQPSGEPSSGALETAASDARPPEPASTAQASVASSSKQPERLTTPNQQPVASTPQVVVDRMFIRMITCAALPVVFGLMMLVVFYYLKEAQGDDFPMWIVYVSQNITFGGGLFGITYGIMSTSWDPSREGSWLGWDEFRANLPLVLNRGKSQ